MYSRKKLIIEFFLEFTHNFTTMNYNNSTYLRIAPETIAEMRSYFGSFNASFHAQASSKNVDTQFLKKMEKTAQDYITRLAQQEKTATQKVEIRNALATISQTREIIEDWRISQRKPRKY